MIVLAWPVFLMGFVKRLELPAGFGWILIFLKVCGKLVGGIDVMVDIFNGTVVIGMRVPCTIFTGRP